MGRDDGERWWEMDDWGTDDGREMMGERKDEEGKHVYQADFLTEMLGITTEWGGANTAVYQCWLWVKKGWKEQIWKLMMGMMEKVMKRKERKYQRKGEEGWRRKSHTRWEKTENVKIKFYGEPPNILANRTGPENRTCAENLLRMKIAKRNKDWTTVDANA